MSEFGKRELVVLKTLYDHAIENPQNPEIHFSEIRDSTFAQLGLTNQESWAVILSNILKKLWKKEGLIHKHIYGHQDVTYEIKDVDRVRIKLETARVGLKPPEKELAFKLDVPISVKTKKELTKRLADLLYNIIFEEKLAREPYSPLVMGFSKSGDLLRDKILFIAPDRVSGQKIQDFSIADFENVLAYLIRAWGIYFDPEPHRAIIKDIMIAKLHAWEIEAINTAIQNKVVDGPDEAVRTALSEWCRIQKDKQPFHVSVTDHRPNLKKALNEGKFDSPRRAVEYALDLLERQLDLDELEL